MKRGIRYDADYKRKVVDFVKAKGRGGLTSAVKEFKVSALTISRWIKNDGKIIKRGRPGRKPGSGRIAAAGISKGSKVAIQKALKQMAKGIENLSKAFSRL